jgi:hypothetical protein
MVSVKKPRYDPSLHCKSALTLTSVRDFTSAADGEIPDPKADVDVTAVPANSTPIAPLPVDGSYLIEEVNCSKFRPDNNGKDSRRGVVGV